MQKGFLRPPTSGMYLTGGLLSTRASAATLLRLITDQSARIALHLGSGGGVSVYFVKCCWHHNIQVCWVFIHRHRPCHESWLQVTSPSVQCQQPETTRLVCNVSNPGGGATYGKGSLSIFHWSAPYTFLTWQWKKAKQVHRFHAAQSSR